jgi:phosphonate transport system substrate-binding protein
MKKPSVLALLAIAALAIAGCGSSSKTTTSKNAAATSQSASGSSGSSACPHNPVRFAVEPYDTGPALEKAYGSLTTDLQAKLGCPVKLIISNSYAAEIAAMAGGQLEMGEFGPLGYVLAHQISDAQPVAAFGDTNGKPDIYYAGIWVKKNSPITSLKQLAGKTLGLSGATSTSGGLYPVSALINAGFKCTAATLSCQGVTIHVTGGHPESLLALTHGTVDAAEVNSQEEGSAKKAHQFNPADYREIWKSTPITNDPITVYGKLSPAFQAKVKSVLLSLSAAQTATVDTELGTTSNGPMVPASDSLYNQVRSVAHAVHMNVKDLG